MASILFQRNSLSHVLISSSMWTFELHKRVEKFFEKHPDLAQLFYDILKEILKDPY